MLFYIVLLTNDWKTAKVQNHNNIIIIIHSLLITDVIPIFQICDFGTAKITDYTGTQTQTPGVGTILYMAPEVPTCIAVLYCIHA